MRTVKRAAAFALLIAGPIPAWSEPITGTLYRRWQPDPAMEWHFNEEIYSRRIGTRAAGLVVGWRDNWWRASGAYLGKTSESFTGTRDGQYTSRTATSYQAGVNLAVTPHWGSAYLKFGQWAIAHYNVENGTERGGSFETKQAGVHRSGEIGIGLDGKHWFIEGSYLNSVYTRQSTVGAEYRQFYMVQIGRTF